MAISVSCIETKRLHLRNICEEDTRKIVEWRADPNVFCYFLYPHAITEEEHINWYKNRYVLDDNRIDWMAIDADGEQIGVFGIRRDSMNSNTAEISYLLSPQKRGMGYAKEAIKALLSFLKNEWLCNYAIAEIHKDNVASIKFAISQGMTLFLKEDDFLVYRIQLSDYEYIRSKNVFIRTDGNADIGTGHVMRCLSIAEQLRKYGAEVTFVTADDAVKSLIETKGFTIHILYSVWNNMESEIADFCKLITSNQVDCVLVDSYYVTKKYLHELKIRVDTYYLDDLNKMIYPVNTLINYNVYAEDIGYKSSDYDLLLLGPRYAPLREEFEGVPLRRFKGVQKILITSGGTDEYNIVGNILNTMIQRADFSHIEFYCVLGKFNRNVDELNKCFEDVLNIHFFNNISNISDYMKECDIAITAGGTTCYELCACGLPSIMYTLADNQFGVADSFSQKGIIPWVGDIRQNMRKCIDNIIEEINVLYDEKCWEQRSRAMQELIDGQGAKRLAARILGVQV